MPSVYGKPWSKMVGQDIPLGPDVYRRLGQAMVDAVVQEARKDFAKQGKVPHAPEGLPNSTTFYDSFYFRILGKSTIEVYSDWPYIKQLVEGRKPYPMTWLIRSKVPVVPIVRPSGELIFRMTPLKVGDAWVHPGFARHTFFQRGIKKGRERMAEIVAAESVKVLSKGDPFK